MTREEAIFCEKTFLGETNCVDCKYYGRGTCKSRESHKMAIAALKAEPCDPLKLDGMLEDAYEHGYVQARHDYETQPCDDCVDRESVLWYINYIINHGMGKQKSFEYIRKYVEKLPTVTPKQRWIPVDYDRYPETYPRAFQEVWMTDLYGEVRHIAYDGRRNIKAWMPYVLPEPYKEGESE